jgi:hypothetical protein
MPLKKHGRQYDLVVLGATGRNRFCRSHPRPIVLEKKTGRPKAYQISTQDLLAC